jgi:hypothetical protein
VSRAVWQCGAFLLGRQSGAPAIASSGSMAAPNISFRFTRGSLSLKPTRCRPQAGGSGSKSLTPSRRYAGGPPTPRLRMPGDAYPDRTLHDRDSVPAAGYSKALAHAPRGSGPVSFRLGRRTATLEISFTHCGDAAPAGRPIDSVEVRASGVSGPDGLPRAARRGRSRVMPRSASRACGFFQPCSVHSPSCWPSVRRRARLPARRDFKAGNDGPQPAVIHLVLQGVFSGSSMSSRSHSSTAAR